LLEIATLGLLKEGPLHGYELRRRLSEFGFWRVSFGSLYPALRKLNKAGHIEVISGDGRRKVYAITPSGEDRFQELIASMTEDEEERIFSVRVAFLRYLEPEGRLAVLQSRREALVARAARSRAAMKTAMRRTKDRLDRYTLALLERNERAVEADIAWIDGLIASERTALGQSTTIEKT
jgi:DNA-binding PadR family transcriptional regulator